MKTIGIFGTVVSFLATFSFGQKQADWWYFGKFAGVHFTSNGPVAVTNGALITEEGCSVISSKEGNLLFYTDGITVWNNKHLPMPHGTGLKGDPSSTQSSVAINLPKQPGKYVLFTVAATAGASGMSYSMIDMSLDAGMGDVIETQKNELLATPVTEKMTAVLHRNGIDIWVIGHRWETDEFVAYLVTEKGVNKTPIISRCGKKHVGTTLNTQGYMKSNPDGTNLALALEESNDIELFDFDNNSGLVSQPISVKMPEGSYVYGVEFSPSGSLLYASAAGTGEVFQFNLQAGSATLIQQSQLKIGQTPNKEWVGALQLANDGKIYFPIYNSTFLGSIEQPNKIGTDCLFKIDAVNLNGKIAQLGLPTFTQSFFEQSLNQKVTYFDGVQAKKGEKLVLKNVQFDFAKSTLKQTSYVELNKVVALMKKNPSLKIELLGHTDNIGNKSANRLLSENRSNAVRDYLIKNGIAGDRITTFGFGSELPVATNNSDSGRSKNRRVEFIVQ